MYVRMYVRMYVVEALNNILTIGMANRKVCMCVLCMYVCMYVRTYVCILYIISLEQMASDKR